MGKRCRSSGPAIMSDDALDDAREVLMALAIPSWMRIGALVQIHLDDGHEMGLTTIPSDDPIHSVLAVQRNFHFLLLGDIVGINIASPYPVEVRCPFVNGDAWIHVPIDSVSMR